MKTIKKIFLALFVVLALVTCNRKETSKVVFNGKMTNYDNSKVMLYKTVNGEKTEKLISVNEKDEFQITLDNSVDKEITISYNSMYVRPYFEFGDTLGIEFFNDGDCGIVMFSGIIADVNEYLADRRHINTEIINNTGEWDVSDMNFNDYSLRIDSINRNWTEKLNKLQTDRREFILNESENLEYIFTRAKINYSYIKKRISNDSLDADPEFVKFISNIEEKEIIGGDVDLYIDVLESKVFWLYDKLKEETSLGDSATYFLLDIINKEIKNKEIKEKMLYTEMDMYFSYSLNNKVNDIYSYYKSLNTNQKYLEELEKMYEIAKVTLPGYKAPNFEMLDREGNVFSLEDFRGKYIYINVWTTWCGRA